MCPQPHARLDQWRSSLVQNQQSGIETSGSVTRLCGKSLNTEWILFLLKLELPVSSHLFNWTMRGPREAGFRRTYGVVGERVILPRPPPPLCQCHPGLVWSTGLGRIWKHILWQEKNTSSLLGFWDLITVRTPAELPICRPASRLSFLSVPLSPSGSVLLDRA